MLDKKKMMLVTAGLVALLGGSALANPTMPTDHATGVQHRDHPRYRQNTPYVNPYINNNNVRYDSRGNPYYPRTNNGYYNNGYYNNGYYNDGYNPNNGYYQNGYYNNPYYDGRTNNRGVQLGPIRIGL
jgi:hypothetical protein